MNELTLITPPPGVTIADYAAIEDAVMETARGRWFLLEYARRQRAAETQRLADAVDRLESAIAGLPRADAPPDAAPANAPADLPTHATAAAVAEKLSDIVWTMRERGVGDQFCAELEKQIRIIRTLRVELQGAQQIAAPQAPALALAPPTSEPQAGMAAPAQPSREPPHTPIAIHPKPAIDPRIAALARLDALPLSEKLALFC